MDYQQFNQMTSKDKYAIPIIEELLDKLGKVVFFSKLGLHSSPDETVFKPFLQKSVLVFFDDILVYLVTWNKYPNHLRVVLQKLREHRMYVKKSKCSHWISNGFIHEPFQSSLCNELAKGLHLIRILELFSDYLVTIVISPRIMVFWHDR
ncbi:reverse transcriptase [Gossypium australe]|uniref:Reverse transcriptase n=1 Tax=Gossypium australe TaxID=47621 RepID=A0A5B6X1N1_9ROSI|nr:reverse transcriptase [Gossypium australe]